MTQQELFAQLDTKPSWGRVELKDLINKLSGEITAFYRNIINPSCQENVTIDRHALSIASGYKTSDEDYHNITKRQGTNIQVYTRNFKK